MNWIKPWFTIWTSPRATIRRIVGADPRKFVVEIVWVGGALAALNSNIMWSSAAPLPGWPALPKLGPAAVAILAFVLGLFGIVTLYALGSFFRWSGAILGGTASAVEVRSALAWSQVPAIYLSILGIFLGATGLYVAKPAAIGIGASLGDSFSPYGLLDLIVTIWILVIFMKCLGEVHHFSGWRALASVCLAVFGALGVALAAIAAIVMAQWVGRSLA